MSPLILNPPEIRADSRRLLQRLSYRVLLTGIYLMHTGVVNANLVEFNEEARLSYIADLNQPE